MDNATHAFAGLLLADATTAWIERRTGTPSNRRLRRAIVGLGIVAAELPDADLLYSGPVVGLGKLGYLLHHRGHTHTVLFAVAAAVLSGWAVLAIRRRAAEQFDARERTPLLVLAMTASLSHLLLDYSNSYGVHPFWPVDNRWVYGDAVFIVEPWLWVVALPPLLFGPRRLWSGVLLSALLCIILFASWTLGELTRSGAVVVTIGVTLWLLAQRWIPSPRRVLAGVAAWCVVEAVFVASSAQARTMLRPPLSPGERIVDIALTPGAANPFCFDALVLSLTTSEYRVRSATVAPWIRSRTADAQPPQSCRTRVVTSRFYGLRGVIALSPSVVNGVRWGEQWSAPLADLIALAQSRCEMAFALRFMRVPVWDRDANGDVRLSDVRFGVGTGGFTDLRIASGPCPVSSRAWIPPWTPPRAEALAGHSAGG